MRRASRAPSGPSEAALADGRRQAMSVGQARPNQSGSSVREARRSRRCLSDYPLSSLPGLAGLDGSVARSRRGRYGPRGAARERNHVCGCRPGCRRACYAWPEHRRPAVLWPGLPAETHRARSNRFAAKFTRQAAGTRLAGPEDICRLLRAVTPEYRRRCLLRQAFPG